MSERSNSPRRRGPAEADYGPIFDLVNDAIFVFDPVTGAVLDTNQKMTDLYGYSREEARRLSLADLSGDGPTATGEEAARCLARATAAGPQLFEWRARDRSGRSFWVEVNVKQVEIEGKERLLAVVRDVDERKRAQETARQATAELEAVFEALPDLCFRLDSEGTYLDVRAGRPSDLYASPEQLLGRRVRDVLPAEATARIEEAIARALGTGTDVTVKYTLPLSGGEQIFEAKAVPYREREVIFVARNVTERERMERALRESEARFRAVFEDAAIGIALVDAAGRVAESNPALCEMLGYGEEELRGKPFGDFTHPDDLKREWPLFRDLVSGQRRSYRMEKRYIRKDGRIVWGRLTTSVVIGAEGEFRFAVGMVEDVTARKRAEAVREEFLNVAAHELRTPLTTLKGCVQMLLRRGTHDEEESRLISAISAQAERLAHLAQALVDMSQIQSGGLALRRTSLNLCELAEEALRAMQRLAPHRQLTLRCTDGVLVYADRMRLGQTLANLLDNAVKYSPHGGAVDLTVERREGEAVVCVRDRGIGIPREKQEALFRAFYQVTPMMRPTTGMGLGLYISREIIHRHGGRMWFESEEGKGSTFCFSLPLEANRQSAAPGPP